MKIKNTLAGPNEWLDVVIFVMCICVLFHFFLSYTLSRVTCVLGYIPVTCAYALCSTFAQLALSQLFHFSLFIFLILFAIAAPFKAWLSSPFFVYAINHFQRLCGLHNIRMLHTVSCLLKRKRVFGALFLAPLHSLRVHSTYSQLNSLLFRCLNTIYTAKINE